LTDLHLSAISEAMNQMIGSAATSMSSMFNKRIDISPPKAFPMTLDAAVPEAEFPRGDKIVKVALKWLSENWLTVKLCSFCLSICQKNG